MNLKSVIELLKKTFSDFSKGLNAKLNYFFRISRTLFHKFYHNHLKEKVDYLKEKIDYVLVRFFHKGELKNYVLVRYLIKELLLYFTVAFLFFFLVFFVNQILLLIADILKKHVPLGDTMRLMVYSLPTVIAQSAPDATLVGFLMCLGRLMSDNEVLIFRASGLGYSFIAVPVIILGIVISLASFFVNDYLLPIGTIKFNRLKHEITNSNPGVIIEPNSIKSFDDFTIVIGDVKDSKISDLVFFDERSSDSQTIIAARDTEMISSKQDGVLLQLNMNDSVVASLKKSNREDFDILGSSKATLNILDSQVLDTNLQVRPREMTSYDLGRQIRMMKANPNTSKYRLNTYKMEFHKKFSNPFC